MALPIGRFRGLAAPSCPAIPGLDWASQRGQPTDWVRDRREDAPRPVPDLPTGTRGFILTGDELFFLGRSKPAAAGLLQALPPRRGLGLAPVSGLTRNHGGSTVERPLAPGTPFLPPLPATAPA